MKRTATIKLMLNKETIRALGRGELDAARGGATPQSNRACPASADSACLSCYSQGDCVTAGCATLWNTMCAC
jgi:hypothetical protein